MKKTKTGLHIETRKNRIEVYTEKELQEKAIKEKQQIINAIGIAILIASLLFFGFIYSSLFMYT
tara:strand:+ start:1648 stop:1839 length:192 start_codon:yes stop_codon:yes gene_type:complete